MIYQINNIYFYECIRNVIKIIFNVGSCNGAQSNVNKRKKKKHFPWNLGIDCNLVNSVFFFVFSS